MPHLDPDTPDGPFGEGTAAQPLPARDALDLPPDGFEDLDPRPILDGDAATEAVAKAVCFTALTALILAALIPAWANGILLIGAPISIAALLSRHRLCPSATATLTVIAVLYTTLLLLFVG